MRAHEPDRTGHATVGGVRLYWEEHGEGERTLLLIPPWQIVDSRAWKMQLAYLSRYARVITYDPAGCGRSDRPPTGYDHDRMAEHALGVMDAVGVERASLICLSRSTWIGVILAATHPERVERLVLTAVALDDRPIVRRSFLEPRERHEGWEKYNAPYWRTHYPDFVEFFIGQVFTEPHSTKPHEDGVAWGLEVDPETLIATVQEWRTGHTLAELLPRVSAPTLILHGTDDHVRAFALAERAHAAIKGSRLVALEGSGHCPQLRDPVRYNRLVRDFVDPDRPPARTWRRAMARPRRALMVSSPIGLGHSLRDVEIARELRALVPDLEIHWLAQDPVTRVLQARGETIHPASRLLAGESAHIESEAGEHELHVFQAWREMDEILLANFMVLHDLLEAEPYDLVIGDEAWEIDYYLHENPEVKRTPFVWLTDFVGWLPMDRDPASREARVAADYNAEMIEHVARFPRVRDLALFVGSPEDIVEGTFGPGLPAIREWTEAHYRFPGYVLPFDPAAFADREALRARLGFRPDERVVLAAVGGTGVGHHLLRKVVAAAPALRRRVDGLHLVVVTGPRIDPASLPATPGIEYRAFVPDLYAHLAGCDLAIVQGGLSTCMELTAAGRPFLYFPLRNHFEQNFHVPHRLARYGAGVRLDYAATDPEALAQAAADALARPVSARPVERDGARRAARLIAPLLDGARR
ncbi:MAG TPA: alpha/beta fold hydrolase [Methylomirabilota bacterium]|nr:alpha/beta fold hydrolase [Methylomirabilota bacterium]